MQTCASERRNTPCQRARVKSSRGWRLAGVLAGTSTMPSARHRSTGRHCYARNAAGDHAAARSDGSPGCFGAEQGRNG